MAKKRKGARPTKRASRSVKKKAARRPAPRKVAAERRTGLEDPAKADFNPLKELMRDHIARLEAARVSNDKIASALRSGEVVEPSIVSKSTNHEVLAQLHIKARDRIGRKMSSIDNTTCPYHKDGSLFRW